MSDYKPIKIKRKNRANSLMIRSILFRIVPIVLVVVICVCGFSIFNKRISEVIAQYKHSALADRGTIDDPTLESYNPINIDWSKVYSSIDSNGLDPLALSPLDEVDGSRPSSILGTTEFEKALGYTNKQATLWSINTTINRDITAWIYMYGLGINYPVAEENGKTDYYLNHSYDGTQSTAGTLFMSSICGINPISRNLIIHGHNMRDGTMFATLLNFLNGTKAFYDSHRYIFIDTLYGTYRYEIYSVYKTVPKGIYLQCNFDSNANFINWCNETNKKGIFKDENTSFNANDRILTLSTCDVTNKYRIVVHAKMVYPEPVGDIDSVYDEIFDATATPEPDVINPDGTPEETEQVVTPTPNIPTPPVVENIYAAGKSFTISLSDPKSTLRLRNQPSTTSVIESALANGTEVTIISEHDDWVKVRTKGSMEGYLLKRYLVPTADYVQATPNASIGPPNTNLITPSA